jgi:uncharacterized membrane protein YhdT
MATSKYIINLRTDHLTLKRGYGFYPEPECLRLKYFFLFFCRAAIKYVFQNIPLLYWQKF